MMVSLSVDPIGEVIDPTYTLEDEDANYLIIFSIFIASTVKSLSPISIF